MSAAFGRGLNRYPTEAVLGVFDDPKRQAFGDKSFDRSILSRQIPGGMGPE